MIDEQMTFAEGELKTAVRIMDRDGKKMWLVNVHGLQIPVKVKIDETTTKETTHDNAQRHGFCADIKTAMGEAVAAVKSIFESAQSTIPKELSDWMALRA